MLSKRFTFARIHDEEKHYSMRSSVLSVPMLGAAAYFFETRHGRSTRASLKMPSVVPATKQPSTYARSDD